MGRAHSKTRIYKRTLTSFRLSQGMMVEPMNTVQYKVNNKLEIHNLKILIYLQTFLKEIDTLLSKNLILK